MERYSVTIWISENQIKKENILESKFNNIDREISLVFIDPPYLINPFEKILINLNKSKILSNNALVIIECSNKINLSFPSFFSIYNKKNSEKAVEKINNIMKKYRRYYD